MKPRNRRWGILICLTGLTALILAIGAPRQSTSGLWGEIAAELTKAQSTPASARTPTVRPTIDPVATAIPELCPNPDENLVFASQLFEKTEQSEEEVELDLVEEAFFDEYEKLDTELTGRMETPDTRQCNVNSNAQIDECGVSGTGNACSGRSTQSIEDDKCCDWTLTPDGKRDKCSCNTSVMGACPQNEDACTICMLIAEASTETDDWCRKMVLCTMRERKKWEHDDNQCVTNARKTGDGTWFTPDKCTCDRTAPNPEKNPNQQYCACREAVCAGGTYPTYRDYLPLLDFQCPAESPNFYGLPHCANPCDRGGGEITPPAGVTCKHKFYRCETPHDDD